MPELREVFEMVTKQTEPEVDAWRRQVERQQRSARNRKAAALGVAAAIGIAAVLVVIRLGGEVGETQPGIQPSPTPAVVPDVDYMLDLVTGEMTPLPESIVRAAGEIGSYAVSSDASMIAFVGSGDGGESEIFVANANGTEIRQVTSAGGATMPAWSPDGETIAFTAPDRGGTENVFLFDFATGVASQLTFEEKFAFNPEFTPDGADVVFSSRRGNGDDVLVVPVAGGTPNFLVSEAGFDAGDGAVSPDGSHLSFAFGPNAGGALGRWLADASGSDRRQIADGATFPSATWSPDGNRLAYWSFPSETVFVYDVASGEARDVADGAWPTWLNAHTLIVEVHAGL